MISISTIESEALMALRDSDVLKKLQSGDEITLQFGREDLPSQTLKRVDSSACHVACPAGVNVKGYLGLIAAGKFSKALALVKETNPLPGICGRVCTHPCESECQRGDADEPVAICALKRFIADYELAHPEERPKPAVTPTDRKVAVIGSGPAGLTVAHDLALHGNGVTIFESLPVAGGMLCVGIPSYRLPREIIQTEIKAIEDLGVEIRLDTTFGKDLDFEQLEKDGYEAVFLGIGAHEGLKLGIPGEDDYEGFLDCVTFLRRMNLGDTAKPGKKVIVIGGGNSAIDSARSALRLGSDEVHIVYRRSRKEMPANPAEIDDAEEEGIEIDYLAAPVKILGDAGKVTGMECIRMKLGEPDESGRRRPIPIEGTEFVIEADVIIPAISQRPDLSPLSGEHGLEISRWNSFVVDEETMATNRKGVFAGGDSVTGPLTVIDAIAAGHRAATSIYLYLRGKDIGKDRRDAAKTALMREVEIPRNKIESHSRVHPRKLEPDRRRTIFDEVESCFAEEEAREEALRCLRCGECIECRECIEDCEKHLMMVFRKDRTEDDISSPEPLVLLRVNADSPLYGHSGEVLRDLKTGDGQAGQGIAPDDIVLYPVYPSVREKFCRGCGYCKEACEYSAIAIEDRGEGLLIARVLEEKCKACGICVALCPSGAMDGNSLSDENISSALEKTLTID